MLLWRRTRRLWVRRRNERKALDQGTLAKRRRGSCCALFDTGVLRDLASAPCPLFALLEIPRRDIA